MLYAIFAYHLEQDITALTPAQDAALMDSILEAAARIDQLQLAALGRSPGVRREHAERGRRRCRPKSPHHSSARLRELPGLWRPGRLSPTSKFARRPLEQRDEPHVA